MRPRPPPPPPPPTRSARGKALTRTHAYKEESYPLLSLASTVICSTILLNVLAKFSKYSSWIMRIYHWFTRYQSQLLVPLLKAQIQKIQLSSRVLTSSMYYEFEIERMSEAADWILFFMLSREVAIPEPRQAIAVCGLIAFLQRPPLSEESPEAGKVRTDLKFGCRQRGYRRDLTLFWFHGALVHIRISGRDMSVRVYGINRAPFLHLLARGKKAREEYWRGRGVTLYAFTPSTRGSPPPTRLPSGQLSDALLEDATKQTLIKCLSDFRASQNWFARRGLAWRHGILLVGPPGCGKRSTIAALGNGTNGNVFSVSLVDPHLNDQELTDLMWQVPKVQVLWLQDFDRWLKQDQERTSSGGSVSTGNTLVPTSAMKSAKKWAAGVRQGRPDGTTSSAGPVSRRVLMQALECTGRDNGGVLFVAAVESLDGIDEEFLRPGRFDRIVHLGKATRANAEKLFQQFYNKLGGDPVTSYDDQHVEVWSREWARNVEDGAFSLADLHGMLSMHRSDPEGAVKAMPIWVEDQKGVKEGLEHQC